MPSPSTRREKEEYGARHIPGARYVGTRDISQPGPQGSGEDLKLKSPEQLAQAFTQAGVRADDTVIAYCQIGQQATAVMFAARTLGHRVLLYDGSFEDGRVAIFRSKIPRISRTTGDGL